MDFLKIMQDQAYHILVVDDEPDIFKVTELSLRNFIHKNKKIELHFASSGKEALEQMRAMPEMAVILLDVVMETPMAGLDACRVIRQEFKNPFVRILLRTGQPGVAPERETIDSYDIDGYLPKAELTSNRLYSSVRTAIRAWDLLIELERHRIYLTEIHESALSLRSFQPIETTLDRILKAAVLICPTSMAILKLETFYDKGNPCSYQLFIATDQDTQRAQLASDAIVKKINANKEIQNMRFPAVIEEGCCIPLILHSDLGYGWFYLRDVKPDDLMTMALVLLAGHAENALYATVARELLLKQNKEPVYNTMSV